MTDTTTAFPLWLLAGLFIAGHLVWGPRWMVDGTRGIWAAYAGLFSRRTDLHATTDDEWGDFGEIADILPQLDELRQARGDA